MFAGSIPRCRVLIVDDEVEIRDLVAELMIDAGFDVRTAEGGEAALKLLEGDCSIELLISDVIMPGMNGFELADAACARVSSLRVLMMSALVPKLSLPLPSRPLLSKPFRARELMRMVEQVRAT